MKCPHCNQEHPEGTKFCPETGKQMSKPCGCPNPNCVNYMKPDLSRTFKFCPECGTKLSCEEKGKDTYMFNPRKSISSVEDFRHGNIIVDGIILGRSPVSELKKFKIDWHYKDRYKLLDGNIYAFDAKPSEELEELEEKFRQSKRYNFQLAQSYTKVVSALICYNWEDIPFLKDIGLDKHYTWLGDEDEKNEIVELLEKNGYVRIEPDEDTNNDGLLFISVNPNAYGHHILIDCSPNAPLDISISILREWTTYYDGIKHSL